jgi:hypothetical protein
VVAGDPRPRYVDCFNNTVLPRPPSFEETYVSDKPRFLRDMLAHGELTENWRTEAVGGISDTPTYKALRTQNFLWVR